MKARPNLWVRMGKLEQRRPLRERWHTAWDLDALSVAELEALMPLSAKHEAAIAVGHEPAWTPAELALLAELGAKAGVGQ